MDHNVWTNHICAFHEKAEIEWKLFGNWWENCACLFTLWPYSEIELIDKYDPTACDAYQDYPIAV